MPDDPSAYDSEIRVADAIRKRRINPLVAGYGQCWTAINRLAPTHTPEELITAGIHLAGVAKAVPWALEDWTSCVPGIDQLLELANFLPAATKEWAVPAQEIAHLPIYASLRIHTNPQRYDHHMQALLVSLSGRISSPDFPVQSKLGRQSTTAIQTLRNWITSLRDNRVRDKRDALMNRAVRDSHSVADFALAVALQHLDGPESGRKELTHALSIWVPEVLGLGRLTVVSNGQTAVSEPAEPKPTIVVSQITSPLAEQGTEPDDGCEDQVSVIYYRPKIQPRKKPLQPAELLREARHASKLQRIKSPGDHFSHLHHSALLPGEVEALANSLLRQLNRKNPDIFLSGAFCLVALTLCTGLTIDRILAALEKNTDKVLPKITTKSLHLRSLLPKKSFKPHSASNELFIGSSDCVEIPLPPKLATALKSCRFLRNMSVMKKAKALLGNAIGQLRLDSNSTHLSLGRIRRTYAVLIYESSWNYPATAILSQDSFSQSDAPLYYYQAGSDVLADIYARAIWTLFGDHALTRFKTEKRIGSQAIPAVWCTREFARKPSATIHQKTDISNPSSIANAHNAISLNFTAILQSVGGHRPNKSIFKLNRWDFSLEHQAAIIADKQSDPAHARRLIGLGSLGTRQLHLYLKHLEALAEIELTAELSKHIRNVQKGRSPLLFKLDNQGHPQPATMEWFRSCLSRAPDIPLNHGRHILASLGRQMDRTRSDLLGIHLGHYESTGYPFSSDSPLVPVSYLRRLNPILDRIFKQQGWRLVCGLADPKEKTRKLRDCAHVQWSTTGPLQSWEARKKALKRKNHERNQLVRAHWRSRRTSIRIEVEQEVIDKAAKFSTDLASVIAWRINERRQVRLKDRAPPIHLGLS